MKLFIVEDNQAGAELGYKIIEESLNQGEVKVMGLATGSTPVTLYERIVASDLDFSDIVSVNLDEYVGIGADHDQSYNYFMHKHLFDKKPFKANYLPNGLNENAEEECARYDAIIEANPIDIQILGIGENGHIGFNEPGSSFDSKTSKVKLTESTILANARMFEKVEDVPQYAYSMGIHSIMQSKKIILFAYGSKKAEAIRATLEGPVDEAMPASILQKHDDVIIICDKEAGSALSTETIEKFA